MKTLYESILDVDLSTKVDTMIDMFGTTSKFFKQMKSISAEDFRALRNNILDGISVEFNAKAYKTTNEEMYAISRFINHMHKKYGQEDIFTSGWCLSDPTWNLECINSKFNYEFAEYLRRDLNLDITVRSNKVDKWIAGVDPSETSWFLCALKEMSK